MYKTGCSFYAVTPNKLHNDCVFNDGEVRNQQRFAKGIGGSDCLKSQVVSDLRKANTKTQQHTSIPLSFCNENLYSSEPLSALSAHPLQVTPNGVTYAVPFDDKTQVPCNGGTFVMIVIDVDDDGTRKNHALPWACSQ